MEKILFPCEKGKEHESIWGFMLSLCCTRFSNCPPPTSTSVLLQLSVDIRERSLAFWLQFHLSGEYQQENKGRGEYNRVRDLTSLFPSLESHWIGDWQLLSTKEIIIIVRTPLHAIPTNLSLFPPPSPSLSPPPFLPSSSFSLSSPLILLLLLLSPSPLYPLLNTTILIS